MKVSAFQRLRQAKRELLKRNSRAGNGKTKKKKNWKLYGYNHLSYLLRSTHPPLFSFCGGALSGTVTTAFGRPTSQDWFVRELGHADTVCVYKQIVRERERERGVYYKTFVFSCLCSACLLTVRQTHTLSTVRSWKWRSRRVPINEWPGTAF